MKDMIKRIREEREGFTLAELLIVVAIIAVLVAIAIPVFNSQLEKSRDAVTVSNIRTAYAEAQVAVLSASDDESNGVKYTKATSSTTGPTVVVKNVKAKGAADGFVDGTYEDMAGIPTSDFNDDSYLKPMGKDNNNAGYDITFTYDKDLKILHAAAVTHSATTGA